MRNQCRSYDALELYAAVLYDVTEITLHSDQSHLWALGTFSQPSPRRPTQEGHLQKALGALVVNWLNIYPRRHTPHIHNVPTVCKQACAEDPEF